MSCLKELKQQLRSHLCKRHISQLVTDHDIHTSSTASPKPAVGAPLWLLTTLPPMRTRLLFHECQQIWLVADPLVLYVSYHRCIVTSNSGHFYRNTFDFDDFFQSHEKKVNQSRLTCIIRAGVRCDHLDPKKRLAWIDLYEQRLIRLAYTYVRDWATSEDRVQDAFIRAYKHMHQLEDDENPFPWLTRIVINECKMYRRRNWREVLLSLFPERIRESTEDEYVQSFSIEQLHARVLSLPESFRTPIILHYFEELSIQQIATAIQKSPGTVKSRLAAGRARLRRVLFKLEEDNHGATARSEAHLRSTER